MLYGYYWSTMTAPTPRGWTGILQGFGVTKNAIFAEPAEGREQLGISVGALGAVDVLIIPSICHLGSSLGDVMRVLASLPEGKCSLRVLDDGRIDLPLSLAVPLFQALIEFDDVQRPTASNGVVTASILVQMRKDVCNGMSIVACARKYSVSSSTLYAYMRSGSLTPRGQQLLNNASLIDPYLQAEVAALGLAKSVSKGHRSRPTAQMLREIAADIQSCNDTIAVVGARHGIERPRIYRYFSGNGQMTSLAVAILDERPLE